MIFVFLLIITIVSCFVWRLYARVHNCAKIVNLIYRQNIGNQAENWYICFFV
jgi:hypothetical protein